MKEKIKTSILIVAIVVVLGGAFYWYEWRPTQAKRECFERARDFSTERLGRRFYIDDINEWNKTYNFFYRNCLRLKGL